MVKPDKTLLKKEEMTAMAKRITVKKKGTKKKAAKKKTTKKKVAKKKTTKKKAPKMKAAISPQVMCCAYGIYRPGR